MTPAAELVELARRHPDAAVVVDEAYVEYGGETVVPWLAECPNLIVAADDVEGVRVRRAPGRLRRRGPGTAAVLEARRAPAPIARPAARIAAAALRDPRYDLAAEIAERERVRAGARRGRVRRATGGRQLRLDRARDDDLGARLEQQGIIVRRFPQGIRITLRRPSENDILLRALGAEPGPPPGREATVIRTSTETALRITLALDGSGRSHVATGIGFLDHLLTLLAFHAGFDLDCVAGGDIDVDEHHTVEDVLAALGSAARAGARNAGGGSALRLCRRADGRGARDGCGRPRATAACGDRSRLHRRAGRRPRPLPAAARARALHDGGRVHRARRCSRRRRSPRRRGRVQGARPGAQQAVAPGGDGIRSTKGAA